MGKKASQKRLRLGLDNITIRTTGRSIDLKLFGTTNSTAYISRSESLIRLARYRMVKGRNLLDLNTGRVLIGSLIELQLDRYEILSKRHESLECLKHPVRIRANLFLSSRSERLPLPKHQPRRID